MVEPNEAPRPSPSVRQPVLLGLFAGTAVGGGYLLAGVPNVEVMSLVIALAGVVLGPLAGAAAGALAAAIYSLGSPYGPPAPQLLVAQMAGLGAAAPLGWLAAGRKPGAGTTRPLVAVARAAAGGLAVTVVYDALTNLAIVGMLDLPTRVVLAGALPFFLIHAASNVAIFGALLPVLAPRLALLGRPRVTGRPGGAAAAAGLGAGLALAATLTATPGQAAVAAADTAAAPPATGWQRPLWEPFTPTFLDWIQRDSPWLGSVDGGVGASSRLTGETGAAPLVVRDGVPLGTGHILADDPWLVGREGADIAATGLGSDGWGGTAGRLDLTARDVDPLRALSSYRGVKGPHQTYFRGVDLVSARAEWRLRFDFDESLDNEGYNHTTDDDVTFGNLRTDRFTGQGKVRQARTRVERAFADGGNVSVEVGTGRRTRDDLPVLGAGGLEAWNRSAAVRLRWRGDTWDARQVVFWDERDVQWAGRSTSVGLSPEPRLLETGRQGLRLDVWRREPEPVAAAAAHKVATATPAASAGMPAAAPDSAVAAAPDSAVALAPPPPDTPAAAVPDSMLTPDAPREPAGAPLLSVSVLDWSLHDDGVGTEWAGAAAGATGGRGTEVRTALGWNADLGRCRAQAQMGALTGGGVAPGPDAELALAPRAGRQAGLLSAKWGGRAPRSEERLTALRWVVTGQELVALPAGDLDREQTLRAALDVAARVAGVDLAGQASARRLRDGITWRADPDDPGRGTWANDLDLTAWRAGLRATTAGRFLGWLRATAEGTWQGYDVSAGNPGPLPPGNWQRLRLDWEQHFFREDGILELSLVTTRRAAAGDPWDLAGTVQLPARTNHDLLVGFRLVGTHLVLGVRNLADQRQRLTAGALSPGRELDLRLDWGFRY